MLTFLIPGPAVSPAVWLILVWSARAPRRGQWFLTHTRCPRDLGRGAEMLIITDLINDTISLINRGADQPFFLGLGFHHSRIDRLLLLLLLLGHNAVDALCCWAGRHPGCGGGGAEAVIITARAHKVSPRLSAVIGGNEWTSLPAKGKRN